MDGGPELKKLARARLAIIAAFTVIPVSVIAQDAQAPQPSAIPQPSAAAEATAAPAPAPVVVPIDVKPDPLIFKRTPVVDGLVQSGEWDTFFSADTSTDRVSTYADWDSRNLYLAVNGTKPVKLTVIIDANGDGWFHGGDNYKFEFTPGGGDAVTVDVTRYDSKTAKPAASPVIEPLSILARSGQDGKSIELAIPQGSLVGLNLKDGKKMGIALVAQVGDSGPIPQNGNDELVKVTLVSKKSASLDPVEIEMDLRDRRVTPGEDVVSKLTVRNKSKDNVDAETFVIGGEGRAAKYLNSEMVRIEGLGNGVKMKRSFRSKIPRDMPVGSWGLGAEVRSASGRLGGTLISFEVVPSYEVTMETGDGKFAAGTSDWHQIKVLIRNNTHGEVVGTVKLVVPDGWELFKKIDDKLFSIPSEDGVYPAVFRVRVTDAAKSGPAQVKAFATIGKEKLNVSQTVEVVDVAGAK